MPGAGVAVGAASFALPLFVLLPFGRPRGRFTGWPSAAGAGPSSAARFVAAFAFSVCRRNSLRYLHRKTSVRVSAIGRVVVTGREKIRGFGRNQGEARARGPGRGGVYRGRGK